MKTIKSLFARKEELPIDERLKSANPGDVVFFDPQGMDHLSAFCTSRFVFQKNPLTGKFPKFVVVPK